MAHNRDGTISTPIILHKLTKLKLAADHVLVQLSKPESESDGGIIIPDSSRRTSTLATLITHGTMSKSCIEDKGLGEPKVGTQIVVSDHMVEDPDFEHDGFMYRILAWDDIPSIWLP